MSTVIDVHAFLRIDGLVRDLDVMFKRVIDGFAVCKQAMKCEHDEHVIEVARGQAVFEEMHAVIEAHKRERRRLRKQLSALKKPGPIKRKKPKPRRR